MACSAENRAGTPAEPGLLTKFAQIAIDWIEAQFLNDIF
jgi:hypothetical protein